VWEVLLVGKGSYLGAVVVCPNAWVVDYSVVNQSIPWITLVRKYIDDTYVVFANHLIARIQAQVPAADLWDLDYAPQPVRRAGSCNFDQSFPGYAGFHRAVTITLIKPPTIFTP
jgi:hypothetical protein